MDAALQADLAMVKGWHDEGGAYFSNDLTSRVKSNLCCAYVGLCLVARVCAAVGLPWDEVFPFDREACAKHLDYAVREYSLDGGAYNKSIVEQTFEVMARMKMSEGKEYVLYCIEDECPHNRQTF